MAGGDQNRRRRIQLVTLPATLLTVTERPFIIRLHIRDDIAAGRSSCDNHFIKLPLVEEDSLFHVAETVKVALCLE